MKYRIEYRRGHAGVCGDDWVKWVDADSPREAIEQAAPDRLTNEWTWNDDETIASAPDESGRWEHNLMAFVEDDE